jgi:plastocyanin
LQMLTLSAFILGAAALAQALTGSHEVYNVIVGGSALPEALTFQPPYINAKCGDYIVFTFKQKNHTLTESAYPHGGACDVMKHGYDSGFIPVDANKTDDFPTVKLKVRHDEPVFFNCAQVGHCAKGMVFAINPGRFWDDFLKSATGPTMSASASTVPSPTAPISVSAIPSPSTTPVNYKVVVGGTGDAAVAVSPDNIVAQPGDTITFEFRQKNHTMTESAFSTGGAPCSPLAGGFDSGFIPVADNATTFPTYTIQVNDTNPIYAYCMQGAHCSKAGQVFAANAPDFAAYKAKAMGVTPSAPVSSVTIPTTSA